METSLNYNFQRKSENYVDWLLNIIKSEKYNQIEGLILSNQEDVRFK